MEPPENSVRTLPLYNPLPQDRDGWHEVRSPGGYEAWHFDAEDDAGRFHVVASLWEGFGFHPEYLGRYRRYLANPTRHAPPLPEEFPCVCLAVYENRRLMAQFLALTQASPGQFAAATDGANVKIGLNSLSRLNDGSFRLELRGTPWQRTRPGPRSMQEGTLSCDLRIIPRSSPADRSKLELTHISRPASGADHRWVIADPLCRVEGEIRLEGLTRDPSERVISFAGGGYHDHTYGSAPPGIGVRRWMRGRVLWDDQTLAFHYARPSRGTLADELHLVLADERGSREVPVTLARAHWSRRTASLLRYPSSFHIVTREPEQREIRLESPDVIDAGPHYVRLLYDATLGTRAGKALCEVVYPGRVRWSLAGRLIQRAFARMTP